MKPQAGAPAQRLAAALAPLRFAARHDFGHLERVRDLEATLARALAPRPDDAARDGAALRQLASLVPPPGLPRADRVTQLRQLLAALEGHAAGAATAATAASGGAQAPPPPAAAPVKRPSTPAMPATPVPTVVAPPRRQPAPTPAPTPAASPVASAVPPAGASPVAPAAAPEGEVVLQLDQALQFVRGVGPRMAEALARRDLHTVGDLLHFFPRRYQGQTSQQSLAELQPDTVVSVEGQITRVADRFVRGRHSLEVVLADATGSVHLVWFRVPGRAFASQFKRGGRLRAAGTVKRFRQALQLAHPEVRHLEDLGQVADAPAAGDDAIVPLYLEVEGLHAGQLRRILAAAMPSLVHLNDPLPSALRHARALMPLADALRWLHQPPPGTDLTDLENQATPAHRRLIYDECFYLQLGLLVRRQTQQDAANGVAIPMPVSLAAWAERTLPFTLTGAQQRALADVAADLLRPQPMQRLVQGDVGSGKTAVALVAAAAVAKAGLQVAMMAPTELLAEQHARNAHKLLTPHGIAVALHTGQQPTAERRARLAQVADGTAQVVIGTHALIQSDVRFRRLGLAIIDEQHRFGVMQRAKLGTMGDPDGKHAPHLLVMTATPIPRTLALTAYGDLELSIIDALPPGRTPVHTKLFADGQRAEVYAKVRAAVAEGRQAYVVFPLVEASDKEGMGELRAATEQAQELEAGVLHGLRLGLLHGRLSRDEKDAVMRAFVRHEVDVLIATTVIEVGIDVANATVMVIEHAERFGLSQLHQLRGRVGRGAAQSSCYLLAHFRPSQTAWRRLAIMEQTNDGFRIAEEDLAIRGPGDFLGTRQSGLPVLSMTNLARDGALLVQARQDAQALLASDPTLSAPAHGALRRQLAHLWQQRLQLASLS